MSRKDKVAIIILLFILFVIDVIIVVRFFTKDRVNKSTLAKVEICNNYEEDAFLDETTSEDVEKEVKEPEFENIDDINIESNAKITSELKKENISQVNSNQSSSISSRAQSSRDLDTIGDRMSTDSETEVLSNYKGYDTVGKIEIPKTSVNMPILSKQTVGGMEIASCLLYSSGKLNEYGNTLIVGHNYRNGKLFSNNDKLQIGDKIFITTLDGKKLEYIIYSKFITTPEDASFLTRDTNGKPEITLSSCSDDNVMRIVILAKII